MYVNLLYLNKEKKKKILFSISGLFTNFFNWWDLLEKNMVVKRSTFRKFEDLMHIRKEKKNL